MKLIRLFTIIFCSLMGAVHANNFDIGECKVFGSTVISTWTDQDPAGVSSTFGAVGTFGDAPALWTVQDITADNPSTAVSTPILFLNSAGDVFAVWTYYDNTLSITRVAGARLENSTTTWVVDILSDNNLQKSVQPGHLTASLSDLGDIFVSWTSFDYITEAFIIEGIYGSITGVWGAPFQMGL